MEAPSGNREALYLPIGDLEEESVWERRRGRGIEHFWGSCGSEENAFSMFLLFCRDSPPSITSANTATFLHLCDLDQANPHQLHSRYVTERFELLFSIHCFNLIFFPSRAAAPVHNSPAPRPSLFSSRCCFAPSVLLHPCVAPRKSWCRRVWVRLRGRVSALIRPNGSHHVGTHTAHYFWLDVNSHEAEGWRRWSSWSSRHSCHRGPPTSAQRQLQICSAEFNIARWKNKTRSGVTKASEI